MESLFDATNYWEFALKPDIAGLFVIDVLQTYIVCGFRELRNS